jgi:hypothetical protein
MFHAIRAAYHYAMCEFHTVRHARHLYTLKGDRHGILAEYHFDRMREARDAARQAKREKACRNRR